MLAWILLALLFCGAGLYILLTPKDVDPEFVLQQASVSATKLPGESPVARSLVNPHGHALLGETKPLSQFRFRDVWADAHSFRIQYVAKNGKVRHLDNLAALVQRVQRAIAGYPAGARIGMRFGVSIEAVVAFFAVALSGRVPVLVDEDEEDDVDADSDKIVLRDAEFKFAMESSGITVKQPDGSSVVVPMAEGGTQSDSIELVTSDQPIVEHLYLEEQRESVEPIVSESEPSPRKTTRLALSEADLGAAIAAQLTALGSQNRWTPHDTVFMAPGPLTVYSFVTMLTALSAKALVVFAEADALLTATRVMQLTKPSVVVSQDETMRTLVKHVDDFQVFKWLEYGWRRLRLARGALSQPPMIPEFRHVRLLHTESGADPYRWLSNGEIATLRVLTGTQVIHTYTPTNDIPVCQTSVGDYRVPPTGVNWGPPLPGLELKKVGRDLVVRRASSREWVPLPAEDATLLRDGCLYVPEKRHDFSDYYYYTGELN